MNLVVQTFLSHLDKVPDHPDNVDYFEQNKNVPFHYEPDNDDDLCALETDEAAQNDESATVNNLAEALDAILLTEVCTETSAIKKVRYPFLHAWS